MRSSLRLGTVSGIPIGMHWSISIIAALFGFTLAGTLLPAAAPGFAGGVYLAVAAAVTIALLGSIIAHELGHSLVAQRHDVDVTGITLFALGGVAKLDREPETPRAAAQIALAGPAVSVAIGVAALLTAAAAGFVGASTVVVAGLSWLGLVNLSLAVFNMLPALPLDGGRALQAALWKRSGDRDRATISAASVGRYMGWAIVAFGAYQFFTAGAGLWTMVIGWFILTSAKAESVRARINQRHKAWAETIGRPITNPLWAPPAPETRRPGPGETVIDVTGQRVG
jgi:Zn-dependent protease